MKFDKISFFCMRVLGGHQNQSIRLAETKTIALEIPRNSETSVSKTNGSTIHLLHSSLQVGLPVGVNLKNRTNKLYRFEFRTV